ncbi:MAG: hypothetical protein IJI10_02580 [Eubacterium sp.]|nr:hypothetical protein [Eubacterium sp.]
MKAVVRHFIVRMMIGFAAVGILYLLAGDVSVFAASAQKLPQVKKIAIETTGSFDDETDLPDDPNENEDSWLHKLLEIVEKYFETRDEDKDGYYREMKDDLGWDDLVLIWTAVYEILQRDEKDNVHVICDKDRVIIQIEVGQIA